MSTDATLAALTAGLDRDEALARAAIGDEMPFSDQPAGDWQYGEYPVQDGDPERMHGAVLGSEFRIFDSHAKALRHIAAHDPARVLRQVEAHRRILARHHPIPAPPIFILGAPKPGDMVCAGCGSKGNGFGLTLWPCPDVQDLAGIYTEPIEEGTAG